MRTTTTAGGRRWTAALVLPAVAVALLSGCSGEDEGSPGASSGTPSATGSASAGTASAGTASAATGSGATTAPKRPASKPAAPPPADTRPPAVAISSLPPVEVGKEASLKDGVVVVVDKVRPAQITASGPGEIAGPGVSFDVEVRNESTAPVELTGFAVTATYGKGTPAAPSTSPPAKDLSGTLAPGKTARGTYVFAVPRGKASSLTVDVSSDSSPNIAVFRR